MKLIKGGEFALLGSTMAPGFEFDDFIAPNKEELLQKFIEFEDMILKLI